MYKKWLDGIGSPQSTPEGSRVTTLKQGACKDYEFSRVTMNNRCSKGFRTPAPHCRPRHGSRQHRRTSVCACSM